MLKFSQFCSKTNLKILKYSIWPIFFNRQGLNHYKNILVPWNKSFLYFYDPPLGQQTYSTPRNLSMSHTTSMPELSSSMSRDPHSSAARLFHTDGRSHLLESCSWSKMQCWGTRRASLSKSSTGILMFIIRPFKFYWPEIMILSKCIIRALL